MSRKPTASAESRWIDLVLERADALRGAGVLSIGPASATFAPFEPKFADNDKPAQEQPSRQDVFSEVAVQALGIDPGFTITPLKEGDQW